MNAAFAELCMAETGPVSNLVTLEQTAPVILLKTDQQGIIVDVQGALPGLLGLSSADLSGRTLNEVLSLKLDFNRPSFLGQNLACRYNLSTVKGGIPLYLNMRWEEGADHYTGVCAVRFTQSSGHDELLKLLDENRKLSRRLLEVQENERRKLARELHDELGQSITAVKSLATAVANFNGRRLTEVRGIGKSLIELSSRLYEVVNDLMARLRPALLDNLSLEEALFACLQNSQLERSGMKCSMQVDADINSLPELVQITVYRIIQECLTNISRHAMASNVAISVRRTESEAIDGEVVKQRSLGFEEREFERTGEILLIEVSDDGVGMNAQQAVSKGMGIKGIRERVEALGGSLKLVSNRGQGVQIKAVIRIGQDLSYTGKDRRRKVS